MISPQTKMFSFEEVAAELGVGRASIERLVADKLIRHTQIGSGIKISYEALIEYVAAQSVNPVRPKWWTPAIEQGITRKIREIARGEIEAREMGAVSERAFV